MKTNYKYHIKIESEYGQVIFDRRSNSAKRLIRVYTKAAYECEGNMHSEFYFGRNLADAPADVKFSATFE